MKATILLDLDRMAVAKEASLVLMIRRTSDGIMELPNLVSNVPRANGPVRGAEKSLWGIQV